jgi:hypothetical protein
MASPDKFITKKVKVIKSDDFLKRHEWRSFFRLGVIRICEKTWQEPKAFFYYRKKKSDLSTLFLRTKYYLAIEVFKK